MAEAKKEKEPPYRYTNPKTDSTGKPVDVFDEMRQKALEASLKAGPTASERHLQI
jgi:hypothetical protein